MAESTGDPAGDRSLNDLPDHLLLYILSFPPTLDAIRTTSLSRKWRNLWSLLSSLNFDYTCSPPGDSPSDFRRLFAYFVDRTLIIRRPHSPLLKLCLQFDFRENLYSSHIDSWIRYAISGMGLVSIRSLYLDQIYLTDEMVSDLILGCSNLETLVLEYCYGMKNLKICSSKLKMLSLWDFHSQNEEDESVEICAPNLRSISIVCFEMGKYYFNETSTLVKAHVDFMHKVRHFKYWSKVVRLFSGVKRLTVQNWWFKLWTSKDVPLGHFALNNLNLLEL